MGKMVGANMGFSYFWCKEKFVVPYIAVPEAQFFATTFMVSAQSKTVTTNEFKWNTF